MLTHNNQETKAALLKRQQRGFCLTRGSSRHVCLKLALHQFMNGLSLHHSVADARLTAAGGSGLALVELLRLHAAQTIN